MTLRKKTGYIIGITVILLIAILFIASRIIIGTGLHRIEQQFMDDFRHLEAEEAIRNMQRVINAFKEQREQLRVKATDWAQWDDAYRFALDKNRAFIESNISSEGFGMLRINLFAMVRPDAEIIYAMALEDSKLLEIDYASIFSRYPFLQMGNDDGDSCGIAMVGGRPMIITSLPIVRTDGSGPVRGAVLFGKYVDDRFVTELASITKFNCTWKMVIDSAGNDSFMVKSKEPAISLQKNDTMIIGTTILHDLNGLPVIELSVNMKRDIYLHSRSGLTKIRRYGSLTMLAIVISIFLTGCVFCFVIFIILEFQVLRKIKQLAIKSEAIGLAGTVSARLPISGDDEIASLATSINTMLEALQLLHDAIADRDREKRMLMNNIPIGLFSLNPQFLINPEHSRSLFAMFGVESCAGRHINDLLCLTGDSEEAGSDLVSYLDLVKRRILPEKEVQTLNPVHELHFISRGKDAWFSLQFYAVDHGNAAEPHILATVVDCTDEKLLSFEMDEMYRENIQLKRIAENPDFFMEFMLETRDIITSLNRNATELVPGKTVVPVIGALFRGIHTIKGVSGSFGLKKLEEVTGEGEEHLSVILENQAIEQGDIEHVRQSVTAIAERFDEVAALSNAMLGDVFDGEGVSVRIPITAIDDEIASIADQIKKEPDGSHEDNGIARQMIKILRRMKMMPAGRALARSLRLVPSLAARLGKQCRVVLTDPAVRIEYEKARSLNVVLVHLIRNAADHGIEPSEERIAAGKEIEGTITLTLTEAGQEMIMILADDGHGLSIDRIAEVAVEQDLVTREQIAVMDSAAIQHLIFKPGLTTTERITEISGRGVGLDTVSAIVRDELHGTITVDSSAGRGTVFTIVFPL